MNVIATIKSFVRQVKDIRERILTVEGKLEMDNYELMEGMKNLPMNCHMKQCGKPAKNRDKSWHYFCAEHKSRGNW